MKGYKSIKARAILLNDPHKIKRHIEVLEIFTSSSSSSSFTCVSLCFVCTCNGGVWHTHTQKHHIILHLNMPLLAELFSFSTYFSPDFCCEYRIRQLLGVFCAGDTRCSSPDRGRERERRNVLLCQCFLTALGLCISVFNFTLHTNGGLMETASCGVCETCGENLSLRPHARRICVFL